VFSVIRIFIEEIPLPQDLWMIEATSKLVLEGKLGPQLRELEREAKDLT